MKKILYILFAVAGISAFAENNEQRWQAHLWSSRPDFYISPKGDDANPGTRRKPFASLEAARDAVRKKIAGGMKKDVLVQFATGNFFIDESVVFDDRDSGRDGFKVIYKGAPELGTRIYGGKRITEWKKIDDSSYESILFSKDMHYTLYENETSANGGVFHQFSGIKIGNFNLRDGRLTYFPRNEPIENQVIVLGTCKDVIVVKGRSMEKIAENIVFDGLYMIGSDFAPKWKRGATWNTKWDGEYDGKEWGGKPLGDSVLAPDMRHGQFYIENARGIKICNSKLYGAGFMAVMFNRWAQENVVENCWIENAGCNGLFFLGWEPGRGPFKTVVESDVNKNNRVRNNVFYDVGRFAFDGGGIYLTFSGENVVEHNIFHGMTRYGVAIKGWRPKVINFNYYYALETSLSWNSPEAEPFDQAHITYYDGYVVTEENQGAELVHSRNNIVRYNDFSQISRNGTDMGMIEMWGAGTGNVWEYNACHDGVQTASWNSWMHVLFNDDGCHDATMRGNIIYWVAGGAASAAIMCKGDRQATINNIIADCELRVATVGPYTDSAVDMKWVNNVVSITDAAPRGTRGSCWMKEVKNNVYAENPMGPEPALAPSPAIAAFLPKPGQTGLRPNEEVGSTNAVPDFVYNNPWWDVNYTDYVLKKDSPALKLGFKQIPMEKIGLRKEFPFDLDEIFAHPAGKIWEAADYSRIYKVRINDGFVRGRRPEDDLYAGSWVRYNDVDFGKHQYKEFQAKVGWPLTITGFIGTSGGKQVMAIKSDQDKSPILYWEVSPAYKQPGKTGPELFDVVFAPEQDPASVKWKSVTEPVISRATIESPLGVVNCDVVNGEENSNSAAYMRSSLYVSGAKPVTIRISGQYGIKVWLNGKVVFSKLAMPKNEEMHVEIPVKPGWNQFMVKVVQDDQPWAVSDKGYGNFWASIKIDHRYIAGSMGGTYCLPGLPGKEVINERNMGTAIELRLDSPDGKLIGEMGYKKDHCDIEPVNGKHDLFLVFPNENIKELDWYRFKSQFEMKE